MVINQRQITANDTANKRCTAVYTGLMPGKFSRVHAHNIVNRWHGSYEHLFNYHYPRVSEWVKRAWLPARHAISRLCLSSRSFNCTGTDNQTHNNQEKILKTQKLTLHKQTGHKNTQKNQTNTTYFTCKKCPYEQVRSRLAAQNSSDKLIIFPLIILFLLRCCLLKGRWGGCTTK